MTDFGEDDHWGPRWQRHAGGVRVSWRKVAHRADDEVVFEDAWEGRPPIAVRAALRPHERVELEGRGEDYEFTIVWTFRDLPDGGTLVAGEEAHRLRGLVNVLLEKRVMDGMRDYFETDRELHFGEMEDELGGSP